MNHKTIGTLALAALLTVLICNAFSQQPAVKLIPNAGEEPRMLPSVLGRYQPFHSNGFMLVDTHTGQCWSRSGAGWHDLGSPVKGKE